jgi:AraC-like DNA-binding protein
MSDLTELPDVPAELLPGPGPLPQSSGLGAMQDGCLRVAKLLAIKSDIARNLDRPDLSIAALATRHACTSRFVQRLFEMVGTTFTEYVLAQRLVRAYRKLVDPRYRSEKISVIAYDCGFNDVSYFNRMFRRYFTAAPSDVRGSLRKRFQQSNAAPTWDI